MNNILNKTLKFVTTISFTKRYTTQHHPIIVISIYLKNFIISIWLRVKCKIVILTQFLGFTTAFCSESDGGST